MHVVTVGGSYGIIAERMPDSVYNLALNLHILKLLFACHCQLIIVSLSHRMHVVTQLAAAVGSLLRACMIQSIIWL